MDMKADEILSEPPIDINALPDKDALKLLRNRKPARRHVWRRSLHLGERIADGVAATVGSWPFIIIQSIILFFWISANVYGWLSSWDPYPFILLNLLLSFQAAYAAPIIMMAQNRQSAIDRKKAEKDYDVNLKAELEIELLHQKIDLLRDQEIRQLIDLLQDSIKKR